MKDKHPLLDGLSQAVTILSEFVATIPPEKMDRRRGESFWTLNEHVSHLADVQPMLLERLQRFVDVLHPGAPHSHARLPAHVPPGRALADPRRVPDGIALRYKLEG